MKVNLGDMRRLMKVCYKNCGDWEGAVLQDIREISEKMAE